MSHLQDDELLELALAEPGEGAEARSHLESCAECSGRFEAVRAEQELLRGAFREVDPPRRAIPRTRRLWAAAAALLIIAGAVVAASLIPRQAPSSARSRWCLTPRDLIRRELEPIVQKIEESRESLVPKADDGRARAFADLLTEQERLYAEALESYIDHVAPLSPQQTTGLRHAVWVLSGRLWTDDDAARPAREYRSKVRLLLSEPQYHAFEEFARQEVEWDRENDIDRLADEIAQECDLKHSEIERLRRALENAYPKSDLPMVALAQGPCDVLAEDPRLVRTVREALGSIHHAALEVYLREARDSHEEAERIARKYMGDR